MQAISIQHNRLEIHRVSQRGLWKGYECKIDNLVTLLVQVTSSGKTNLNVLSWNQTNRDQKHETMLLNLIVHKIWQILAYFSLTLASLSVDDMLTAGTGFRLFECKYFRFRVFSHLLINLVCRRDGQFKTRTKDQHRNPKLPVPHTKDYLLLRL